MKANICLHPWQHVVAIVAIYAICSECIKTSSYFLQLSKMKLLMYNINNKWILVTVMRKTILHYEVTHEVVFSYHLLLLNFPRRTSAYNLIYAEVDPGEWRGRAKDWCAPVL